MHNKIIKIILFVFIWVSVIGLNHPSLNISTINQLNAQETLDPDPILDQDPILHAKAVERDVFEDQTYYTFAAGCWCLVARTRKVKVGSEWCCMPATIQDRCRASGMCG